MRKPFRLLLATVCACMAALGGTVGYYNSTLPDSYYVRQGETLSLHTTIPIASVSTETAKPSSATTEVLPLSNSVSLRLFGLIPVKSVEITAVDTPLVVPGGMPFGVKLLMDGVMVVGMGDVAASNGGECCPAEDAGIRVGDIVESVNNCTVSGNTAMQEAIAASDGHPVTIRLRRAGTSLTVSLLPVYSDTEQRYQAGMWVRDSTAGIGTITFVEPDTGRFAGLGHPICDMDTGEIIPLSSGEVADVSISGVVRGTEGCAGELQGHFTSARTTGVLTCNNRYGVFGSLTEPADGMHAIPLGMKQDITAGAAQIYSTISGREAKAYDIVIEDVDMNSTGTKNLIVRITDPDLLAATGGIVQGMSGSPILQNGRLVGAVTHVFVNDPTRGYGIFAESMYESGRG